MAWAYRKSTLQSFYSATLMKEGILLKWKGAQLAIKDTILN